MKGVGRGARSYVLDSALASAPLTLALAEGASARRKCMSDQVLNKAVVEESQARVVEMALPSPPSASDKLLSRIAILLFIIVAGLLTVFGYYAS